MAKPITFDRPTLVTLVYDDGPVRFDDVNELTEGSDGSLRLLRPSQVIRVQPGYRYYTIDTDREDDDAQG